MLVDSYKIIGILMRPSACFILLLLAILSLDGLLFHLWRANNAERATAIRQQQVTVTALGLTDLCVATEARYTRHPAVSDPIAPFMDHPGAIEHFPSGSFWRPVSTLHSGS